jgi:alpha-glucosidase
MLALYRSALALRRSEPGLAGEAFRWVTAPDGVLAFERGSGFRCLVNLSGGAVPLPADARVLVRSDDGVAPGDPLPSDAAAWVRVG